VSEADIAIVGSGATGTLLAARLAAKGHKVVILEGGPNRALSDLVSSTVWSRRLKWGGSPVRVAGKDPVAFPFEAGWGRGGSALHHYACWFRLHREDFAVASLHGAGLDWPMRYEDLRPYYDALQAEIVGQATLVERLLVALLADGHLLVEGAPGLAKTSAIRALAARLHADFARVQFTPDLLPADLTGTEVWRPQDGRFWIRVDFDRALADHPPSCRACRVARPAR